MKKRSYVFILALALAACAALCACGGKGAQVFAGDMVPAEVMGRGGQQAVSDLKVYSKDETITITYTLDGKTRTVTGRFVECRPRSESEELRYALSPDKADSSFLACYYSPYSTPRTDEWVFDSFGIEYDMYDERGKRFEISNFVLCFRDPAGGIGYHYCADPEFSAESIKEISSHAALMAEDGWEALSKTTNYPQMLHAPSFAGSYDELFKSDPFVVYDPLETSTDGADTSANEN